MGVAVVLTDIEANMGTEYSTAYCKHCDDNVKTIRKTPSHLFHLIMSVLTCGVWLLVWASVASEKETWRCSQCGSELGGGSNGWGLVGQIFSSTPQPEDGLRVPCPFCKEMVKSDAIFCKHCHKDIPPQKAPQPLKKEEKCDQATAYWS